MQEIWIRNGEDKIYAQCFMPKKGNGPWPVVLMSHGYGVTHERLTLYAQRFAKDGIAAVTYDFCGGGPESKSSRTMLEMSVLTEASDLETVLDWAKGQPDFDSEKIVLMGGSQGAYVSTVVAGRRPDEVRCMVLLYPGYVLQDAVRDARGVPEEMLPETFQILEHTVSRMFVTDIVKTDIWKCLDAYKGDVLILHGDADDIVPIAYSRKALEHFEHAQLRVYEGANHGFTNGYEPRAAEEALAWLKDELAN